MTTNNTKKKSVKLLASIALLSGLIFATAGVATAAPTIDIAVNDSLNGQDTENITVNIATETPNWVVDRGLTSAQYNAFDTGNRGLNDAEVRAGIQTYVQNSISGTNEIDGVEFNDNEIRALISGYVQSQLE